MKHFILAVLIAAGSFACFAQEKQVHDAMQEKYGEPGKQKLNEWLANMNGTIEPEYNFPMSADMVMTSYKKGKAGKPVRMTIYVNNDKDLFGAKMVSDKGRDDMLMIVEAGTNNIVMLNEKERTAFAMNMGAFMSSDKAKQIKDASGKVDCKKTGNTKTINGYACEEYICTNEEKQGRYELFITNQVKFNFAKGTGKNNPFAEYFNEAAGLGGMMMEGKFYEKDELQATVSVTGVNTKANYSIKTEGYKTGMQ